MAARQECSICMDYFKEPKLLPCHHSYCYKCLEDYVRENLSNGQFNCPLCRKTVALPAGGVSDFQANFYIESDQGEKFPCDICGPKSVACSRCLDCEENLCQSCCFVHEKSKGTRHHKMSDLGTLEPDKKSRIRQRIFCENHEGKDIELVCQDCKSLICLVCKVVNHDHHAIETTSDAAAKVRKSLQIKVNECSVKSRRLTDSEREANDLEIKINAAEKKEMKALEDQRLQLIRLIDKQVAKMRDKIHAVYADLRKQNAALKKDLMEQLKTCSTTNENARQIIDKGTDIDIIKKVSDMEKELSMALRETVTKTMTRMDTELFTPVNVSDKDLIPIIGMMRDSTELSLEEAKKERELREKQEKEEKEKREREKKQIQAWHLKYAWHSTKGYYVSASDESIISWMCPKCQGWKRYKDFGFHCKCGGAN